MQALKESKRQPGTRGLSKETGTKPRLRDESIVVSATSKHSKEDKLDDKEKDDKEGDVDDKDDETESDEDDETKSDDDDIYKYKICVCKDEDEEMIDAEVDDSVKGNEKITDAAKADAEKTSKEKDDAKKTELPLASSSLYVSLGFGNLFLKLSFDSSLVSTVKDFIDANVSSLLDIPIQQETPPSVQKVLISVIPETTNLSPILKILIETLVSFAVSSSQVTPINSLVQQTTKPIPTPPTKTDAQIITTSILESNALTAFPESSKKHTSTIDLEQGSKKIALEILQIKREQAEKQQKPKFTIKSTDKAALEEPQKKHHDNDEDDNDEDPLAGPNKGKKTKRRITKESKSSKKPFTTKETPKGKALSKGSKIGKSTLATEPVEDPIAEVIMDDAGDDVVRNDDQPQAASKPKTAKTLNPEWFKQPPRPPTPDPE
nr:hypothetical protein [Tanacetum cinerariifolium]